MAYNQRNKNTFLIGAAIAAGVVGTLTTLMWPRRRGWTSPAKDMADQVARGLRSLKRSGPEAFTKNFMIGSVAGGVIGAATALLLTPKSGRDLIRDLAEPFQDSVQNLKSESHSAKSTAKSAVKKASSAAKSAAKPSARKATATARHVVSPSPKRVAQKRSSSSTSKHPYSHEESHYSHAPSRKSKSRSRSRRER